MDRATRSKEQLDALVLENVSKWQISKTPLASLTEEQLDVIYQVDDVIKSEFCATETQEYVASEPKPIQVVDTYEEYIKLYVELEDDLKNGELQEYTHYYEKLKEQSKECYNLFSDVSRVDVNSAIVMQRCFL